MNKFKSTLSLLLVFLLQHAFAQMATLSGVLTEEKSGAPLIAATVLAGGTGTVTDLDGRYELELRPGNYSITFSYVGLETAIVAVVLKEGEKLQLNQALTESSNILSVATVTSGKHEKALGEVTVSLDVIKPSLIQNTNQTSLSGLLDKVPGVSLIGGQANIRGGSGFSYGAGSRVLLLVDDMPIMQADAGYPQWEDVPLENIEQVEVVKGAASALYGSSAMNGIINVRTAYAKAKPETKFSPFVTLFDAPRTKSAKWWDTPRYTAGASAIHRQKFGKLDLVLGGNYLRNESTNDSTWSRRGRINANLRYRITDRISVGLNTNFNKSKSASFFFWDGNDSLLLRPGAPVSEGNNLRFNIDPYITYYDASGNRHKLQGRFFGVKNKTGTSEADQSNRSEVVYGEYQFQRKMERIDLVVSAGIVYIGTAVRAPLYGDTTFTSRNTAGYVQLDKQFFGRLNLSGGFRYESNLVTTPEIIEYSQNDVVVRRDTIPNGEIKESKPVFRFGASYELAKATFLRASWGQGYRFPSIAEKFIYTLFGGVPILPNIDLTSETGWSSELGLRQGFKLGGFSGFLDLSGFVSEYQDMMEFNLVFQGIQPAFQSQNVGDTRIRGIEASITGRGNLFGLETTVLAGYTYIDPKFKEWASEDSIKFASEAYKLTDAYRNAVNSSVCSFGGDCENVLKYRYRHTAKVDIESKAGKFSFGVSVQYNSFMENIDAIFESPFFVPGLHEYRLEHNKGDLVLGARTAYYPSEALKFSFLVGNLTNREWTARPGLLEPTRNFTLRVDYGF